LSLKVIDKSARGAFMLHIFIIFFWRLKPYTAYIAGVETADLFALVFTTICFKVQTGI